MFAYAANSKSYMILTLIGDRIRQALPSKPQNDQKSFRGCYNRGNEGFRRFDSFEKTRDFESCVLSVPRHCC
ncbi:uncharacterized protein ASPGLDRAFT_46529 [Aspergillus glaucus CBS 516.65]|uniref:Uncharacterized protein n=1 Tax=Aspergillus glaucus CBS 516.65 TaxID=1160497 RepID=A0A1L9VL40_ASPGL|nr:hypothetical protein ASPGLDRAFT_46529 [Aspergillus glaucus CBS 516.65]OJJ84636.1 hypothetical protein ASPGLDRAFT_46529 [Aspergillus glaucus CBS 516.65]